VYKVCSVYIVAPLSAQLILVWWDVRWKPRTTDHLCISSVNNELTDVINENLDSAYREGVDFTKMSRYA